MDPEGSRWEVWMYDLALNSWRSSASRTATILGMTSHKQSYPSNIQASTEVKVKVYAAVYRGIGNSTLSSTLRPLFPWLNPVSQCI
jgi:hypothetical protein